MSEIKDISDLFKIEGKFWLQTEDCDFIQGNPFQSKDNRIYDVEGNVRDEVVAQYYRGWLSIKNIDKSILNNGQEYWFISAPKMEVEKRTNSGSGTDIFNLLIGNVFKSEDIPDKEKERVVAIINAYLLIEKPILDNMVQDIDQLMLDLANANTKQSEVVPIDKEFPNDVKYRGILKKVAYQLAE